MLVLEELYARIPTDAYCAGCHACAIKCSGAIPFAREEWERVRQFAAERIGDENLRALLVQDKTFRPDPTSEFVARFCPLYDMTARRCAVYPVRPLICRLLGFVEWLPCPLGRALPALADGVEIMRAYYAMDVRPVDDWLKVAPLAPRGETLSGEGME